MNLLDRRAIMRFKVSISGVRLTRSSDCLHRAIRADNAHMFTLLVLNKLFSLQCALPLQLVPDLIFIVSPVIAKLTIQCNRGRLLLPLRGRLLFKNSFPKMLFESALWSGRSWFSAKQILGNRILDRFLRHCSDIMFMRNDRQPRAFLTTSCIVKKLKCLRIGREF